MNKILESIFTKIITNDDYLIMFLCVGLCFILFLYEMHQWFDD